MCEWALEEVGMIEVDGTALFGFWWLTIDLGIVILHGYC